MRAALFEEERNQWLEEKSKVISYQKQMQLNYVQLCSKTQRLEAEVQQLTLDLERKELQLANLQEASTRSWTSQLFLGGSPKHLKLSPQLWPLISRSAAPDCWATLFYFSLRNLISFLCIRLRQGSFTLVGGIFAPPAWRGTPLTQPVQSPSLFFFHSWLSVNLVHWSFFRPGPALLL